MKTIKTRYLCIEIQLYKIGILIGVTYIMMNVLIISSILISGARDYAMILLSAFTIMTSIMLIYGLIQDRHTFLLPWLSNVAVLILFNLLAVIAQFEEANREVTRFSFYMAFCFFMFLELQVLSWYLVFTLMRVGHRKHFRVVQIVEEKPEEKKVENPDTFKVYVVGTDRLNEM
ncbi:uncharacterized protein ACRADG_010671 isoform 2-T3 [Cochliomyia hominivorax]